jgi:hypothetical protein
MKKQVTWIAALLTSVAATFVLTSWAPQTSSGGFGVSDVNGRYSFFLTGELTQGPLTGPFDAVGIIVADGHGNFPFATRTINLAGQVILQNDTASGSYTVNPDGTGSAIFQPTSGGPPATFDIVLTSKREFLAVVTSMGVTGYGTITRQN